MEKILISACLLGQNVRYNGSSLLLNSPILERWISENRVIPCCPEVEGGMEIPRAPAEIGAGEGTDVLKGRSAVMDINGRDVTEPFIKGAEAALALCRKHNIKIAVLAEGSPSCGSRQIYNGSFESVKKNGAGVTAALLRQHGIEVFPQDALDEAVSALISLSKKES